MEQHHRTHSPTNTEFIDASESIDFARQLTTNPHHIPIENQRLILSIEPSTFTSSSSNPWILNENCSNVETSAAVGGGGGGGSSDDNDVMIMMDQDDKISQYNTQFLNVQQRDEDLHQQYLQEHDQSMDFLNDLLAVDDLPRRRRSTSDEPLTKKQKVIASLQNNEVSQTVMNDQEQNDFLKMLRSEQEKQAQEIEQLKRQVNELMIQLWQKQAADQQFLMYQQYQQQQYQLYQYQQQQQALYQALMKQQQKQSKGESTKSNSLVKKNH
jgi:hypothetical protein